MASTCKQAAARPVEVQIWDLPTRVLHAVLIVTVAVGWATSGAEGTWFLVHKYNGYVLASALLARFVWGFAGSRRSRFADFVRPWRTVRDYAAALLRRDPPPAVGHNPFGGWLVVALLAVLAMLVVTGLFAVGGDGDAVAGPLAGIVPREIAHGIAQAHGALFRVVIFLVTVHVCGVLVHGLLTGERAIRAMWSGRKMLPEAVARGEQAPVSAWWGLAVLVVSGLVVWFALP
jgi:cytochrome b